MENYQASGFDQNLIRQGASVEIFDNANIDQLISDNSLSGQKVVNLEYAKITNVEVTNGQIVTLSISKLTAGTLDEEAEIGSGNVVIDGANERILVNDGSTNRVVIGKLS